MDALDFGSMPNAKIMYVIFRVLELGESDSQFKKFGYYKFIGRSTAPFRLPNRSGKIAKRKIEKVRAEQFSVPPTHCSSWESGAELPLVHYAWKFSIFTTL